MKYFQCYIVDIETRWNLQNKSLHSYLKKSHWNATPIEPSKHFNVVSTLSFGWRDVATWDNVKSTLKQRSVFQRWNLQRRINVVYFNVDMNNVRQLRNNVVISNVEFYNFGKRWNNVVKMTASIKNKKTPGKIQIGKIQIEDLEFKVLTTIS